MKLLRWQWPFYIFGWITGLLSPLFWLIQYMCYLSNEGQDHIIDQGFHRRVWKWGMAMFIIFISSILFGVWLQASR